MINISRAQQIDPENLRRLVVAFALTMAVTTGCISPKDVSKDLGASQSALSVNPRAILAVQRGQALVNRTQVRASSASQGAQLSYFGGRVVSNVEVVQVIWGAGNYIPQVTSTASPSMATFYQGA